MRFYLSYRRAGWSPSDPGPATKHPLEHHFSGQNVSTCTFFQNFLILTVWKKGREFVIRRLIEGFASADLFIRVIIEVSNGSDLILLCLLDDCIVSYLVYVFYGCCPLISLALLEVWERPNIKTHHFGGFCNGRTIIRGTEREIITKHTIIQFKNMKKSLVMMKSTKLSQPF